MKTVVMTVSSKGGTGKSVVARYLADRYARDGISCELIDTDGDVGQLRQYHGDSVVSLDARSVQKMLDVIAASSASVLLIDMPGRGLSDLSSVQNEYDFFGYLAQAEYAVTLLNVVSPFRASTRSVGAMIELAGEKARYVAVLNHWYAEKEQGITTPYSLWYGDEKRGIPQAQSRRKLIEAQGVEVELPRLACDVMALLDVDSLTFSAAAHGHGKYFNTISDRQAITTWIRRTDAAFETAQALLGMP